MQNHIPERFVQKIGCLLSSFPSIEKTQVYLRKLGEGKFLIILFVVVHLVLFSVYHICLLIFIINAVTMIICDTITHTPLLYIYPFSDYFVVALENI